MGLTHTLPVDPSFVVEAQLIHNVLTSEADSGQEQRYKKWSAPKRQYRLKTEAMTAAELELMRDFFIARDANSDPFIFLPPINLDRMVKGVACGTGNGVTTIFYLQNSQTPRTYMKIHTAGTRNVVYKDAVVQSSGFTLANDDGNKRSTVTFSSAPANGVVITVDVDRYLCVRFVRNQLQLALEHYGVGSVPEYELLEVLRSSL